MKRTLLFQTVLLLFALPVHAQQSAHYKVESGTFGGSALTPGGGVAQSARFVLSLDEVGGIGSGTVAGPTYQVGGGLSGQFPLPGEVQNLQFVGPTTIQWDPGAFAADYALYQGAVVQPFDAGYGTCTQPPPSLVGTSTTVSATPPTGGAFFYLLTGRNLLAQESTKGFTSAGVQRPNPAPCP